MGKFFLFTKYTSYIILLIIYMYIINNYTTLHIVKYNLWINYNKIIIKKIERYNKVK